jgi:flavodoxin
MKTLIICISVHHRNTKKVAVAMAEVLDAQVLQPSDVNPATLAEYDLIGFGSGIYHGEHHKSVLKFVDSLPAFSTRAFIFSTAAGGVGKNHQALKERLAAKGFELVGEFSCRGFTTHGVVKYIGGINRKRPNEKDLREAQEFARKLLHAT